MSKKNKTQPVAEATQPVPVATPEAPAVVTRGPGRFNRMLESQATLYVADQKMSEVPLDLAKFVIWCQSHPPVEKVGTPSGESVTGKVWAYCDELVTAGTPFTRKAVIDTLVGQGFNRATVSTQYQRWTKARAA